jgi:hypothetical protein
MQNNAVVDIAVSPFDVAQPLFWVDAIDGVAPGTHRYIDGEFIELPQAAPATQPVSTGTQEL